MGLISLVLPSVGEKVTSSDPRIVTAFSTLQTVINGNLNTENLENSAVTSAKIAASFKEALPIATGQTYQTKSYSKAEWEAGFIISATRASFVLSIGSVTGMTIGGVSTSAVPAIVPLNQTVKGALIGASASLVWLLL